MTAVLDVTSRPSAAYPRGVAVLTFARHGLPVPQGSKSYKGQTRSGHAILVESAKGLKPWRAEVQRAIIAAVGRAGADRFPLIGPIAIDLVFTVAKPKSAPKTRRTWPVVKPDIDKLARAVLDAGTIARLWGDDSQVVSLIADKAYPHETPLSLSMPGVYATVYLVDQPVIGEQLALAGP